MLPRRSDRRREAGRHRAIGSRVFGHRLDRWRRTPAAGRQATVPTCGAVAASPGSGIDANDTSSGRRRDQELGDDRVRDAPPGAIGREPEESAGHQHGRYRERPPRAPRPSGRPARCLTMGPGLPPDSRRRLARKVVRANARSLVDWNRDAGSFSRHRRTMSWSAGGSGCSTELVRTGAGSERIALSVSAGVSRPNARRPCSISKSTQPNAKMSAR